MRTLKTSKLKRWMTYAAAGGVPRRSFAVGIVVGTVLNLINQGDAVLGGQSPQYAKIVLTYVVPYLVATYGAVAARVAAERRGDSRDV